MLATPASRRNQRTTMETTYDEDPTPAVIAEDADRSMLWRNAVDALIARACNEAFTQHGHEVHRIDDKTLI